MTATRYILMLENEVKKLSDHLGKEIWKILIC